MDSAPEPAPQPRPSTSGSNQDLDEEVDICLIVGEQDGPRLRELLELNQLKIVSKNSEGEGRNSNRDKLQTEISKLQEMLASRTRALDEANDALETMRTRFQEADERSETLQLSLATQQAVIAELEPQRDLELENKCRAAEETVKELRSQLEELRAQIMIEKSAKETVSKEKEDLQAKFQEERQRRNNEIIALKNENERLTEDKMRFAVLVRQLSKCTESPISIANQDEMLSPGVLKQLGDHIENLMKARTKDRDELIWSRNFSNQIECLLRTRRKPSNSSSMTENHDVEETIDSQSTNDEGQGSLPPSPPPRSPSPSLLAPPTPPPEKPSPQKPVIVESREKSKSPETSRQPLVPIVTIEDSQSLPPASVSPCPPSSSGKVKEVPNVENESSDAVEKTPVIDISLSQDSEELQPPLPPPPQKQQPTSCRSPQKQSTLFEFLRPNPPHTNHQRGSKPVSKFKQLTEFAITTKRHGFHSNPDSLSCLCGKEYKTRRGLRVHVRKMTTEWKFKCSTCQHYFFYQSELNKHLATTNCGCGGDSFDLDAFLEIPPQESQKQRPSTSFSVATTKRAELRKLQQDILKRKKHTPWLSKVGTVQGSWYCSCMSKFKNKARLMYHVQYWSKEWKFQCEQCHQKFFSFSDLRKHLKNSHKVPYALGEYSVGCHLCGKMFRNRSEFFVHKKLMHNIHSPKKRQNGDNATSQKWITLSETIRP